MASYLISLLERLIQRRVLRRWTRTADRAATMPAADLRQARSRARELHQQTGRVLREAAYRLTLPAIGSDALRRPAGADRVWRPDPWRGPVAVPGRSSVPPQTFVGEGVTLFHDCPRQEITFRQVRNSLTTDLSPFGLKLDVLDFAGSFLSLAIDLPDEVAKGLQHRHLIRLEVVVTMERPLRLYGRLNIRHGPNTEQILRELPVEGGEAAIDFDLTHAKFDERRVERLWLDLILEGPRMNEVTLRDVTLSRRLRAGL